MEWRKNPDGFLNILSKAYLGEESEVLDSQEVLNGLLGYLMVLNEYLF